MKQLNGLRGSLNEFLAYFEIDFVVIVQWIFKLFFADQQKYDLDHRLNQLVLGKEENQYF